MVRPLHILMLGWLIVASSPSQSRLPYEKDVRFAVDEIGRVCAQLLETKRIDWKKVTRPILADARKVRSDSEHLVLLVRLLARLEDGHAQVRPLEKGKDVKWPDDDRGPLGGPGMFWCRVGKSIHLKSVFGPAEGAGLEPGMEVVRVDGEPVMAWIEARLDVLRDRVSFSTEQHAFHFLCHQGLADPVGTRRELELRDPRGKSVRRTLTVGRTSFVPHGPAYPPEKLESSGNDVHFGLTAQGNGYVHVRRCPQDLPEHLDRALAEVGDTPGLVLDLRGNSGGGFDHEAFMGRFVPPGKRLAFNKTYESAGPKTYGGPVVVIIDGTVKSAGETLAAIFKEDGRGYVIGESPTAGMSSQKTTIELPSGLFALYVSTRSNMQRSQGGRGIEGLGIAPHRVVAFDSKDLAQRRDTLILEAEKELAKSPWKEVPYDPKAFGWSPPEAK